MPVIASEVLRKLQEVCGELAVSAARITYAAPMSMRFTNYEYGASTDGFPLAQAPYNWRHLALPRILSDRLVECAAFGPDGSASWLVLERACTPDLDAVLTCHVKLHAFLDAGHRANGMGWCACARLTDRECEVLAQAACGMSSREIGERLSLSARTVDHYICEARRKLVQYPANRLNK